MGINLFVWGFFLFVNHILPVILARALRRHVSQSANLLCEWHTDAFNLAIQRNQGNLQVNWPTLSTPYLWPATWCESGTQPRGPARVPACCCCALLSFVPGPLRRAPGLTAARPSSSLPSVTDESIIRRKWHFVRAPNCTTVPLHYDTRIALRSSSTSRRCPAAVWSGCHHSRRFISAWKRVNVRPRRCDRVTAKIEPGHIPLPHFSQRCLHTQRCSSLITATRYGEQHGTPPGTNTRHPI